MMHRFHGNKRAAGSRRPGGEQVENNKNSDRLEKYLEKYCKKHDISREEAMTHALVKEYARYIEDVEKGKISVTEINAGCGGAELGGDCK